MVRRTWVSVAILTAGLLAPPGRAGSVQPSFVDPGESGATTVGGADMPDEASLVIATGDFNRDGIADLVEATAGRGNAGYFLTVLLGQKDGKYIGVASQDLIGKDPRALVVGDLNGDGNPDVLVGDGDGAVLEFLGDGKGGMVDAGKIATLGSVASMATGHFTHSGHLDVVVSDSRSNTAVILLGTGNGSFRRAWSFQLPRVGRQFRVATADFNQDGIDDLLIGSDDSDDYEVMLGNGNGTFTFAPKLSHVRDPNSYCPS